MSKQPIYPLQLRTGYQQQHSSFICLNFYHFFGGKCKVAACSSPSPFASPLSLSLYPSCCCCTTPPPPLALLGMFLWSWQSIFDCFLNCFCTRFVFGGFIAVIARANSLLLLFQQLLFFLQLQLYVVVVAVVAPT